MKRTVFISHSSADKEIAEQVCEYLEKHGVLCWIAPRDVTPGKNYGAAIIDAIDECRVFVLILSSESNKSRQVVREVERAASTDSVILPFRIEDVQPSRDIAFYVSAAHWLDAAKHPVQEQYDELLAAIQNWQKADQTSESAGTASPPLPPSLAAPPAVTPGAKKSVWLSVLIGAVAIGAIAIAALYRFSGTREAGGVVTATSPTPELAPSPNPTAAATPANELTATPTEAPTATPSPSLTPPASPPPTPIRLKPGERLRGSTPTVQSVIAPSPATPPEAAGAAQPSGIVVREVAASSQLNSEYRPNYAFDGNPATGWAPKGTGIEQSLFVHFKTPTVVQSVSILNGDGRDEEHYKASNRIKTLRIVLSDGTNQLLTFKDEMKMQRFELKTPVTASWAKFEIVSVFSGKTRRSGIAEIGFNEP